MVYGYMEQIRRAKGTRKMRTEMHFVECLTGLLPSTSIGGITLFLENAIKMIRPNVTVIAFSLVWKSVTATITAVAADVTVDDDDNDNDDDDDDDNGDNNGDDNDGDDNDDDE
ncbi:hypothetical protein WUBG_02542 [Wuchereria bancrofti]|uniref:Uncharacterized protein n=1 Tax=Wuchereria bancrofti TaxID=6293 RepID=J9EVF7_WUCBA|nr:hypothetical protein WUBG_02542 [Wuchereria bancrofti]